MCSLTVPALQGNLPDKSAGMRARAGQFSRIINVQAHSVTGS